MMNVKLSDKVQFFIVFVICVTCKLTTVNGLDDQPVTTTVSSIDEDTLISTTPQSVLQNGTSSTISDTNDDDIGKIFETYENEFIKNQQWNEEDKLLLQHINPSISENKGILSLLSTKTPQITTIEYDAGIVTETIIPTTEESVTKSTPQEIVDVVQTIVEDAVNNTSNGNTTDRDDRTFVVVVTTNIYVDEANREKNKRMHDELSFGNPLLLIDQTNKVNAYQNMHNQITTDNLKGNRLTTAEQEASQSNSIAESQSGGDQSIDTKGDTMDNNMNNVVDTQLQQSDKREQPALVNVDILESISQILDEDIREEFTKDIPNVPHVPLSIDLSDEVLKYSHLKDITGFVVEDIPRDRETVLEIPLVTTTSNVNLDLSVENSVVTTTDSSQADIPAPRSLDHSHLPNSLRSPVIPNGLQIKSNMDTLDEILEHRRLKNMTGFIVEENPRDREIFLESQKPTKNKMNVDLAETVITATKSKPSNILSLYSDVSNLLIDPDNLVPAECKTTINGLEYGRKECFEDTTSDAYKNMEKILKSIAGFTHPPVLDTIRGHRGIRQSFTDQQSTFGQKLLQYLLRFTGTDYTRTPYLKYRYQMLLYRKAKLEHQRVSVIHDIRDYMEKITYFNFPNDSSRVPDFLLSGNYTKDQEKIDRLMYNDGYRGRLKKLIKQSMPTRKPAIAIDEPFFGVGEKQKFDVASIEVDTNYDVKGNQTKEHLTSVLSNKNILTIDRDITKNGAEEYVINKINYSQATDPPRTKPSSHPKAKQFTNEELQDLEFAAYIHALVVTNSKIRRRKPFYTEVVYDSIEAYQKQMKEREGRKWETGMSGPIEKREAKDMLSEDEFTALMMEEFGSTFDGSGSELEMTTIESTPDAITNYETTSVGNLEETTVMNLSTFAKESTDEMAYIMETTEATTEWMASTTQQQEIHVISKDDVKQRQIIKNDGVDEDSPESELESTQNELKNIDFNVNSGNTSRTDYPATIPLLPSIEIIDQSKEVSAISLISAPLKAESGTSVPSKNIRDLIGHDTKSAMAHKSALDEIEVDNSVKILVGSVGLAASACILVCVLYVVRRFHELERDLQIV